MRPLVSILIPSYNSEAWIDRTLESALAQTYPQCEIIVVDDGSTDGTLTRLRGYEARGVRIVTQANRGASAARNRALADASGELIQFLDADDLLAPDKIAAQVALLEQRGFNLVASGAWARFVDNPADSQFAEQPIWRDLRPIDFLVTCALEELVFPPSAWLVPRRLCDQAGGWNETISMNDDGEYMSRVLAESDGIAFCAEARTYYRSGNPLSHGSRRSAGAADSDLRAWNAIVGVMQSLESSARVATAAATGYQRIQATYYGQFPEVVDVAALKERELGGGAYRFNGGWYFRAIVRLFGWKRAMRMRHAKAALWQS
jgi:glycosyltransferase involved in cell wall biosynthesis